MKNHLFVTLVIMLVILAVLPTTGTTTKQRSNNTDTEDKLNEIQQAIRDTNAEWTAEYTSISNATWWQENRDGFGCIDEEIPDEDYETVTYSGTLPDEFDWRNVNGINYVTPVKNQASCGSCSAFGTLGSLEAVVQIETSEIFDCDLSEAQVYFCNGGDCTSGIALSTAVNYIGFVGVADELCLPYTTSASCEDKASNWRNRVIKASTESTTGTENIKNALLEYGPVVTRFDVYEDFMYYTGGIYELVSGAKEGGHAVTIVGYNDDPGYWICKNSWGTGWGETNPYATTSEKGYFRIKYGECNIGANTHYFYNVTGNIQPGKPENLSPYDDERYVEPDLTFTWSPCEDLDGDEVYYIVYLGDSMSLQDDDIVANHISSSNVQVTHLEKATIYFWKVVSEDEHGAQHQSEIHKFYTRSPCQPDVQGPSRGRPHKEYTFKASTTDTDGEEYYWFFNWGDNSSSGWIGPLWTR